MDWAVSEHVRAVMLPLLAEYARTLRPHTAGQPGAATSGAADAVMRLSSGGARPLHEATAARAGGRR